VLSQPNAMDISYSSVDEEIGKQLVAAPEVSEVSAMLQGFTAAEDQPFFFIFGYPDHSFIMPRFKIKTGAGLDSHEAVTAHGKPVLLGSAAAEILDKSVGDTLRLTGSIYRIIGIYETGDAFEDSGAVMSLKDALQAFVNHRRIVLERRTNQSPSSCARCRRTDASRPGAGARSSSGFPKGYSKNLKAP